jgi:hypothetical protein
VLCEVGFTIPSAEVVQPFSVPEGHLMSTKSLRHVAAVAAVATVGGVLPFFAAATASAAEPTNVTLNAPTAQTANAGQQRVFTGSLSPANAAPTHPMFANVQSGPDASTTNPLAGSPCQINGLDFSCPVTPGNTPGVDSIRFFYDAAGTGTFQNVDPFATGTLTVVGPVNAVSLTPTTANAGAGGYQAYTTTATDALGRAKSGVSVALTATDTNALPAGHLNVVTAPPPAGATFGGGGTGTATATTGDDGKATFYVASSVVGTVALNAEANNNPAISSNGSLTVNPAGLNDVTSVQISPANQNAFVGKPVQQTITLRNAQGNPVAHVTPVVTIMSGPDAAVTPTVLGPTDGTGTTTVNYQAGATAGTDSVRAYVNQTNHPVNTNGLDPGEPSGTASVVVAAEHVDSITNKGPVTVPTDTTSTPVTFKLATNNGTSAAGYNLQFSVTQTNPPGKYTLSQSSGVTDANGDVTVTVTNANPANNDSATVTATLVGDALKTSDDVVTWQARTAQPSTIAITPSTSTAAANSSVTHTVTVADQFGAPVSGLDFTWTVNGPRNTIINNPGATGTGASFTYTDVGPAIAASQDDVMVSVSRTVGGVVQVLGTQHATQYFVVGTAQATQVNIGLNNTGSYVQTPPYAPNGFLKQFTTPVTADPTTTPPFTPTPLPVDVQLRDANGNALYGKSVSFSSNGVGVFTDANGKPIGNSTTATVAPNGKAMVYVRSTQGGTQTITATADGITDQATVSYTGQYMPVTPTRVLDSRTGQGGLMDSSGSPVVGGRLAPNSVYHFNYGNANMPQNAAAYAFNVTAIQPNGAGNLRVGPGQTFGFGSDIPQTSLVNYQAGKDVANFAIVPNGMSNTMAIYTDSASVSVAIDLMGSYPSPNSITTVQPYRVVDTRTGLGLGGGAVAPVAAGTSRSFQIGGTGGQGGIPATGAKAVALNVTAINPSGLGNLRIYADGQAVPNTSIINYVVGQDKAAYVIVDLPANGKIDVFSDNASADVAIDAFASFPTSSNLVTSTPTRILDTRTGGTLAANTPASFQVAGKAGVPADAQAVLVSVTAIHNANSTGVGNLRVYPTGTNVPFVSTLNYLDATSDVANFAIVKLGTNGQVSLYSDSSPIDVAVDVVGFIPANG